MGIVAWFKNLWENKEASEDEVEFYCPRCGSNQIGYFSVISNYVQVIRGLEQPKYVETQKCSKCGYATDDINNLGRRKKGE